MPLRLMCICQGATAATRAASFPLDEPLENGGADAAAGLLRYVKPIGSIWSSPALAARQTAAAISPDAKSDQQLADPQLADCDYGRWKGRTIADIQLHEPEALAAWMADFEAAPHGGESFAMLRRRVAEWMDARAAERGHVVMIADAAVIRMAVLYALDAPAASFWRIDVGPLAMIELRHDGRHWKLRAGNAFAHPRPR